MSPGSGDNEQLVAAFLGGDRAATDELSVLLMGHAGQTARSFLGTECPDAEDIAQDGVVAVLTWLRRRGRFRGSIVGFTVTVVRNRCRNYRLWLARRPGADIGSCREYLADPSLGPLDLVLEKERRDLVREAVAGLGPTCRRLLTALFRENRSVEEIRRESGLGTVQAVYHRRRVCLQEAGKLLRRRLLDCSSQGDGKERRVPGRSANRRET